MSFLSPLSIAVIGASAEETKVGHYVLRNIITQGYKGAVFPVNPKGGDILGKKTYTSVTEIPGELDCAVIVTPAKTVTALAEECGKKGVKTLVVISAGFGETGTDPSDQPDPSVPARADNGLAGRGRAGEGHAMEQSLIEIVKKYDMQLVGPNCLGIMRPSIGLNASFAENVDKSGSVALLSQSGAMAVALLDAAGPLNLGFSLVVSMGNKAAMDECDFLEICKNDPETKVIGVYLESIKDGKRFLKIASEVCARKPIVLIKAGTSQRGMHAVASHTGALAGSDAAIDAACRQTGIRRAHTTEAFMDMIRALAMQPPLLSPQIAVITNAGGPGILATDAAEKNGLILMSLGSKSGDALKKVLPAAASVANPVDVLGDADMARYEAALDACVDDKNIDGIAVMLTPQVMTPESEIAQALIKTMKSRPLMPIVTGFMGEKNIVAAQKILHAAGIPNYPTPERAIAALASLRSRDVMVSLRTIDIGMSPSQAQDDILDGVTGLLPDDLTTRLFSKYNLPMPESAVAKSADEAVALAEKMGYPVVAKISSPQILHKSDIGGVRVNLTSADSVTSAFTEIMVNAKKHQPDATLNGVLIQQFLPAGNEFIVGAIRDSSFGHLIMVGLGGIYTELFRDTSFRIAPIGEEDAYAMLQELKAWKLLLGLRGKAQSDIDALAQLIAQVSKLVTDYPQIKELDLNPVLVWEKKIVIADAKVVIE